MKEIKYVKPTDCFMLNQQSSYKTYTTNLIVTSKEIELEIILLNYYN